MLRPGTAKNFSEYANQVFLLYHTSQAQQATRVDVIWDVYVPNNLKSETRTERGKGTWRCVEPLSRTPGNWQGLLRLNKNKTELFSVLANQATLLEAHAFKMSLVNSIEMLHVYLRGDKCVDFFSCERFCQGQTKI